MGHSVARAIVRSKPDCKAPHRLAPVILIALPFGLFLMMMHIKYDYIEKLWTHPLGIKMSVYALIAQLVGALVIRKIVNMDV